MANPRTVTVFTENELSDLGYRPLTKRDEVSGRDITAMRVRGDPILVSLGLNGPGIPHVGVFAIVHTQHVNMMAPVLLDANYETSLLR